MSANERIRSFIAVDLDDPGIKGKITAAQRDLQQTGADLKLVEPEILHLTLRFLGEIPQSTVQKVKEILDAVRFQTFEANFTGLGAFPSLNRINVVWVGIVHGHEELRGIFEQAEPQLRQIGMAPDNKGFSPHLTIARVRSGRNKAALGDTVRKMKDLTFGSMPVTCVRLKKSTLTPKGPIYTTIHEVRST
jgi:2'-5' RNA ligase